MTSLPPCPDRAFRLPLIALLLTLSLGLAGCAGGTDGAFGGTADDDGGVQQETGGPPPGGDAPPADPPADDPPAEDPPAEDPPAEDPPADDPPAEDPPADDPLPPPPPPEDPPGDDPPGEDPPAEDPPGEDPPGEDPPGEDPPGEDPPGEDPPGEDDSGDDSPPAPGGAFGKFTFAEVPDIAFVELIGETEEMGLFFLEPEARVQPGDDWWLTGARLQLHDELGGGDYQAPAGISLTSVAGDQPVGITYDVTTGELTYDGSAQPTPVVDWTVRLRYESEGGVVESDPFRIRVLRPTIVFGWDAASANLWGNTADTIDPATGGGWFQSGSPPTSVTGTFVNASSDAAPNVVFITSGVYDSDAQGLNFFMNQADDIYIFGDPNDRAVLMDEYFSFSRWGTNRTTYIKNLEMVNFGITGTQLNLDEPQNLTYSKLLMRDGIIDDNAIGTPNWESTTGTPITGNASLTLTLLNLQLLEAGGSVLKHPIYVQSRPNTMLHANNLFIAGGRSNSGIKSTLLRNRIRNTHIQTSRTLDPNDDSKRLAKGIDISTATDSSVYNATIIGLKQTPNGSGMAQLIYWRARRSEFGSEMPPPPDLLSVPPYLTSVVGGGYEPPGGLPDGWPSTPDTYMDPDFWAAVGAKALSDPTNEYSYKKYVSFTRMIWVERTERGYTAYRDDGTFPGYSIGTNTSGPWPIATTPYWRERSASFMANNHYQGWLEEDTSTAEHFRYFTWTPDVKATQEEATVNDYYGSGVGPWPGVEPFPVDFDRTANHTYLGGDTGPHPEAAVGVDGDGNATGEAEYIALPDWFVR